jgi:hypothetical protein
MWYNTKMIDILTSMLCREHWWDNDPLAMLRISYVTICEARTSRYRPILRGIWYFCHPKSRRWMGWRTLNPIPLPSRGPHYYRSYHYTKSRGKRLLVDTHLQWRLHPEYKSGPLQFHRVIELHTEGHRKDVPNCQLRESYQFKLTSERINQKRHTQ